jgi:hypothetical protein
MKFLYYFDLSRIDAGVFVGARVRLSGFVNVRKLPALIVLGV